MSETLYGGATPASTNLLDGTGLTLATRVRVKAVGTLDRIGWRFPDTLPSQPVQWFLVRYNPADDSAGASLGSGTISGSAGQWNWHTFSSPISVNVDEEFVAEIWTRDRYVAEANYFATDRSSATGKLIGPADSIGTPNRRNGRFWNSGTPQYANQGFNATAYFVDLDFTPAAVASEVTLTPAVVVVSAQALTPVPGPTSVTLTPAVVEVSAQPITPVPGPTSVTLTPAVVTVAAVPLVVGDPSVVLRPELGVINRPDLGVVLRP